MKRHVQIVIGGCVLLAAVSCRPSSSHTSVLLTPSKTATTWQARAAGFPKTFVDSATFLLAHGMSDPRGGEYRHARVLFADLAIGAGRVVEGYGWLLPPQPGQTVRFLCMDGIVYQPIDSGKPANLAADVAASITKPSSKTVSGSATNPSDLRSDTGIALVLIDGHPDLARALFAKRSQKMVAKDFMRLADPFLTSWWDQIVSAHLRGDDSLAFHKAVSLAKYRPDYERQATRVLGEAWVRQMAQTSMGGNGKAETFRYLDSLDDMVKDSARRVTQGVRKPLDFAVVGKMPRDEQVKTLVEHLDELQKNTFPNSDPLYRALIAQGKAALDRLVEAMVDDERLTRSLASNPIPARSQVLPVKEAARMAIGDILHWPGLTKPSGAPATALEVRQFIRQNGLGSKPEDWFAVLADDNASPDQWLQAAQQLMTDSRTGVADYGSITASPTARKGVPINASPKLNAEPLRSRIGPSLSDLLKNRALQIANDASSPIPFANRIDKALVLSMFLSAWDSTAALPVVQKVTEVAMAPPDESLRQYDVNLTRALQVRLNLGDRTVFPQYGAWLATIPTDLMLTTGVRVFALLSQNASLQDVRTLADRLFVLPRAPLNLARLEAEYPDGGLVESFAISPLLQIGSMHQAVQEMLDLKPQIGWVSLESHTRAKVIIGDYVKHVPFTAEKGDKDVWKTGERREYRACDLMASILSQLKGAPKFEPQWPIVQRDKAIEQISAFLDKNEAHLGDLIPPDARWDQ